MPQQILWRGFPERGDVAILGMAATIRVQETVGRAAVRRVARAIGVGK